MVLKRSLESSFSIYVFGYPGLKVKTTIYKLYMEKRKKNITNKIQSAKNPRMVKTQRLVLHFFHMVNSLTANPMYSGGKGLLRNLRKFEGTQ